MFRRVLFSLALIGLSSVPLAAQQVTDFPSEDATTQPAVETPSASSGEAPAQPSSPTSPPQATTQRADQATAQPTVGPYGTLSPILTIDQERLFLESAFGRRVQRELERDQSALASENRQIEGELIAEEKALTAARATTPQAEFSELARQFDEKVQGIRAEQDRKSLLLQRRLDQERTSFLSVITPILGEIARARRAYAILDRNVALLALEGIDITSDAINIINERIGEGGPQNFTPPEPRPGLGDTLDAPSATDAAPE